jgi:hypothetical protein
MRRLPPILAAVLAATFVFAAPVLAMGPFGGPGYSPQVPVSAFARPAAWFDPSRLQVSTELSFGTSGVAGSSSGLAVTRFAYQFGAPLAMRVSVGNAFGGGVNGQGQFFLEGLDLSYRPFGNFRIDVHYQDVRTPMQYGRYGVYDPFSPVR